ncbi:MAG: hypothetical protein J5943_06870 [Oribacterium sp.]|nr:hypothetical protein [Oribacterium sp.]MBP3804861.1 hypothetical protein [Oribacterium sp.]
MSINRPTFLKKELALSSSPYLYTSKQLKAYAVEINHRDPVDGDLLQKALDRTLERMPYLSDTFVNDGRAFYYAENPLPMEAAHFHGIRQVGGKETNYHMLDVTWDDHTTWFTMFHGFCDGQGIYFFLETVIYYYYCLKDGKEYDPNGIRTHLDPMTDAETLDPITVKYSVDPEFKMPEGGSQKKPYSLPETQEGPEDEVRDYGIRIPSGELMSFVKGLNSSPSVVISMLVCEAIQKVHPECDAPIVANIPLSARKILDCPKTFKNCSNRVLLPITGTPMDAMPFEQKAAALRGVLKMQLNPNILRTVYNNIMGPKYIERMTTPGDYWETVEQSNKSMSMICHDTFYTDYIGSLHTTEYTPQITGIHFLCAPPMEGKLHLNIIEHNGSFQINCLAHFDISVYVNALMDVLAEHGLGAERDPDRRFSLPRTQWRDSMGLIETGNLNT